MMTSFYQSIRRKLEARRRYRQLVAEIASLSQEELIDMGAFQADLYRAARKEIYG